ncbi:hypothetical protein ASH02_05520 [Nocardioides sp. Soil796]|nr:hypothetical protein ASH02_05520 [Nocardioides sp. Soil796]
MLVLLRSCLVLLLMGPGLFLSGASPAASSPSDEAEPTRILIVGDSVTHGSSGDWTWRYRLWQQLVASGATIDFVGPRDDLHGLGPHGEGSQDYMDPDFDRDHASLWGLSYAFPDTPIDQLVEAYRPDVVVVMLGVNDLTWLQIPPAGVDQLARDFIAKVRAADSSIRLVVSRVPQHWVPGAVEYNAMLSDTAAELTTEVSPIRVADADKGFEFRQHTWDPGHPNAAGEYVLAAAVEDALSGLGVGSPFSRPFPDVPLGPRGAPPLSGSAADGSVALSWTLSPRATSQIVEGRDRTNGTPWRQWAEVADATSWHGPAANGHRYEFRLRPVKGYWAAEPDIRSNVVTVTPRPAAPGSLTVSLSPFGQASLAWTAVSRADAYQVRFRKVGAVTWSMRPRVTTRRATLSGLRSGARYEFSVRAWRDGIAGTYRARGPLTTPLPRPVHAVQATSPRRDVVAVSMRRVPEATRYRISAAAARNCRSAPTDSAFRIARRVSTTSAVLTSAASHLWVRVVAERGGVAGRLAADSAACVRVR